MPKYLLCWPGRAARGSAKNISQQKGSVAQKVWEPLAYIMHKASINVISSEINQNYTSRTLEEALYKFSEYILGMKRT